MIEGPHAAGPTALSWAGSSWAWRLVGFVLWELSREEPLLDPRLFRRAGFASGSLSITLQFLAFFGFVFIGLQYLQLVLDYSPLRAALAFVPMGMTIGAMSRQVAPRLARRLGGARVNSAGLALAAAGFCVLAGLGASSTYWHVLAGLLTLGAGMGLATAPATSAIVTSLPDSSRGSPRPSTTPPGGRRGHRHRGAGQPPDQRVPDGLPGRGGTPPEVAERAASRWLSSSTPSARPSGWRTRHCTAARSWTGCSVMGPLRSWLVPSPLPCSTATMLRWPMSPTPSPARPRRWCGRDRQGVARSRGDARRRRVPGVDEDGGTTRLPVDAGESGRLRALPAGSFDR